MDIAMVRFPPRRRTRTHVTANPRPSHRAPVMRAVWRRSPPGRMRRMSFDSQAVMKKYTGEWMEAVVYPS